jgi:hypothetical protein
MAADPTALPPRTRWALVLLLPALSCVVAHAHFFPAFQTNDDVAMGLMAAGAIITREPSPFLLFVNPLIGLPLSKLYAAFPHTPWYYLAHLATHLLAGVVCAHAVLVRRPTCVRAGLLAAFFLTVDVFLYMVPQFTITAGLAATAAVLLWLSRGPKQPWTPPALVLFPALLGISAAWREHSCLMVLGIATPLAVVRVVADWRTCGRLRVPLLTTVLPFVTGGLGVAVAVGFNTWFYRTSPGWEQFETYNSARAKLVDYEAGAYSERTAQAYTEVGWFPADYELVAKWCLIDRQLFGPANVMRVAADSPTPKPKLTGVSKVWEATRKYPVFPLFATWAAVLALFTPASRSAWACYLLATLAGWAIWFTIGLLGHYRPHVFQTVMACVLWVGLMSAGWDGGPTRAGLCRLILAAAVLLASAVQPTYHEMRAKSREAAAGRDAMRWLMVGLDPKPDRVYVIWGSAFPFEWIAPWDDPTRYRGLKGYPLGCSTHTPHGDGRLAEFGITDPVAALYTGDRVRLITFPDLTPLLAGFVARHRRVDVVFEQEPVPMPPAAAGRCTIFAVRRVSGP